MILVTGATGNLGKSTIDFLLEKGIPSNSIAAMVRDETRKDDVLEKGISIRIGDYDNYDQLVAAFAGIDKLLLVSGTDIANRGKQHKNVVEAAKVAGVKHIYYTSFERKNETETSPISFIASSHIETEKLIKASELTFTLFRNNLYLDVLPWFFGAHVLQTGVFLPAGDTRVALTLRRDMAEAIANVLTSNGHENMEYALSNTENVTMGEIARELGGIVGKEVPYISPTNNVYVETLTKENVPAEFVKMFAGFAEAIKQGEFEVHTNDLAKLLGRKPTTVKQYLKMVYAS